MCAVSTIDPRRGSCRLAAMLLIVTVFCPGIVPGISPALADSTVTFGGSVHYPPFHQFDEQGTPVGFDIDVFREIALQSEWDTAVQLGNWETIQLALAAGEIDIVPMFVSAERSERFLFSDPINIEYHLLFGLADGVSFSDVDSLSGYRVAAENGAYAISEIARQNEDIIIVSTATEPAALDAVLSGEADVALLPSAVGWHSINAQQLDNIVALSPPILPVTYAFAINPARPELLSAVNIAILQMQRDNTLDLIRQRWLAPEPQTGLQEALQTAVWIVLPLVLIAVLTLIGLFQSRKKLLKATVAARQSGQLLRETRKKALKLSNEDSLTGLPNRRRFTSRLERRLARSPDKRQAVAVLALHNLETIQHVIDDDAGDELIRQFAGIVKSSVPHHTGYLGSGQFALLLENVNNVDDAREQVQSLVPTISQDLDVAGMTIHVQVSGGLALFPDHAQSETQLIQRSKIAMSNALRSGARLMVYSDSMKTDPQKLQLMSDLKIALAGKKLQWAMQPQYDVNEQRVMGSEILVRWHHPDYGWVSPGDFVVWAEQMGTVSDITHAAIRHACGLMSSVHAHSQCFALSVNLSANDLANERVAEQIIESAGANAQHLTLEITETALMRDVEAVKRSVELLKQAGITLSLDDYGTGYSSLEYLKAFNFDELKIDRMFISDIAQIDRNLKLTKASIELGHNLGARVVAEGVEDRECADILIDMGCDILQGYYIGKPVVPTDIDEYMTSLGRFRHTDP